MVEQYFDTAYSGSPPENYQRYFVPAIGAPLARDLIETAELRPGERVLDVACGTGVVTRLAAAGVGASGSVTGLDLNPGMLAVARSATPAGYAIAWHQADAAATELPGASFDVVLCQMGLQFMPDRAAALREMRRLLTPGGRLILNMPGPTSPPIALMEEALERHVGPEAARFVGAVFSLYDPDEIRTLLEDAGFHKVSVRVGVKVLRLPPPEDFLWQYVHSTPLAGLTAKLDDARRAALEHDVVTKWQEFVNDGALSTEQGVVVATAWA